MSTDAPRPVVLLTVQVDLIVDVDAWAEEYGVPSGYSEVRKDIESYYDPATVEAALIPEHLQHIVKVRR